MIEVAKESQAEPSEETRPEEIYKREVVVGSGSLVLAALEAVCLFLVSVNGMILLLGGASIGVAQALLFFHSAAIRLPIMGLATAGALLNLWLLINAQNLRNAHSARWRKKPLSPSERRRIVVVAVMSVATLLIVVAELYFHHRLHGSAFSHRILYSFSPAYFWS